MADYEFRYAPLTGPLPGKQMIEQTEQAINELASLVDDAAGQVNIISTLANEANENAATAVETAEEALATSGRVYITVSTQTDADTYFDSELIYIADSTSTNIPTADTGFLEVKTNDDKTATEQVFIADSTGDAYYRNGVITAETVGDVVTYSVEWGSWSSLPATQAYVQEELTNYASTASVETLADILMPVGCVQAYAGSTTPNGWLLCDGSAVSRTDYADLFAVIGTMYGTGDGSTTFNVPSLVNKFIEGSSTSGTTKAAGLPNILADTPTSFPINATSGSEGDNIGTGAFSVSTIASATWTRTAGSNKQLDLMFDASKSNSIYGNSTTVQPPALTMRYIIKY